MSGSLHLVSGEKGRVGSSLFCRLLIEYFQQLPALALAIGDGEVHAPIGRTYSPNNYLTAVFNANKNFISQNDPLLELALEGQTVVLNLSSGSFENVNYWLESGDFLSLSAQLGVRIWKWFIVDGSADSLALLKKSYQVYGDLITHVIVKNRGLARSWGIFDNDEILRSYQKLCQSPEPIEMPNLSLPPHRWDIIKDKCLTLAQASDRSCRYLTVTEKHSVHVWRRKMFESINSVPFLIPLKIKDPFVSEVDNGFFQ